MDTVVQFDVNACVICRDYEGTDIKLAEVKTEGRSNLIDYSCKRKDVDLFNYLSTVDVKNPKKKDIICQAKTDTIHSTIQRVCREKQDKWAFEVSGRIETSCDLHAADAVYHKNCCRKFVTPPQKVKPVGRPPHENAAEIFDMICNNFENSDSELLTVDNLIEEMTLLCDDPSDVYSSRYMKSKLYERYGDDLFIADFSNRKNVICFNNTAKRLINDSWYSERESDIVSESKRIVETAAKLIKNSIREKIFDTESYPAENQIKDKIVMSEWVPDLLLTFLKKMICDEMKQISLGHCIVQASRPKSVISPILFGVGISIDHKLGGTGILHILSRLGLSISPDEITRYKQSVVQTEDANLPAIDGLGTFHGMGMISMTTKINMNTITEDETLSTSEFKLIKRLARVNVARIALKTHVPMLRYYAPNIPVLSKLKFKPLIQLQYPYSLPASTNHDLLWQFGVYNRGEADSQPNWSGYMQDVNIGEHSLSADIRMQLILDQNPNDRSCILSTLSYVRNQASKLQIETACITFDQPLWIKAVEIIESESLGMVCRLGTFHMIMNFLGSIGTVMAGSGISEILECCYGSNAIIHMLSGKAVARALRGHFLIESALHIMIMKNVLNTDEPPVTGSISHDDINELLSFYDKVNNGKVNINDVDYPQSMINLDRALSAYKSNIANRSRTAKLWLQYLKYIDVLKTVIRAERTCDWNKGGSRKFDWWGRKFLNKYFVMLNISIFDYKF
ncbi:hypothetical protein HELRODRAFT_177122 [Helobdella robusta]|uniref:Uncharacterized protein n=1 Tax=Helobdella robusta TaxID=6412 RepID=T1FB91_HELRO|nr:hypothetical protein HELRODRAFT_177122 [Helobdella robusta]ESN98242.1 hypothetical protein HELRODRAFT_177122 [Helobdella robusta]